MSKGTIIYAGAFELPDKSASANRVVNNGKLFSQFGFNVVYLGVDYSSASDSKPVATELRNMYSEKRPGSVSEWIKRSFSVKNIGCLIEKYPDTVAVILYNAPYSLVLNAQKTLKQKSIMLFYDCTEWSTDTDGNSIKKAVKYIDEYFIRNKLGSAVDGIIAVSTMMRNAYTDKCPVLLLPPLVDTENEIWRQERLAKNKFEFCFAGFPDGNKERLDVIVDAFFKADFDANLRIIGINKAQFLAIYPRFADKLSDSIIFMGRLSHSDTICYILSSDCYIFIRQDDRRNNAGFPTKFAESYTCGLPIISTCVSDIPNYLKNNQNGILLNTVDIGEVKTAMERAFLSYKDKETELSDQFDFRRYKKPCADWLAEVGFADE